VRDPAALEGKELEFKLVKIDKKRNNIVVSRRAVVEAESSAERKVLMENLEEGQIVIGVVKNLTDYGAFIDLGGIDGLLHITDMAYRRVRHPSEMVEIGQEIKVKILKFDRDKNRVSLGLKQLAEDPWLNVMRRFPVNSRLFGRVTNLTDYGCFIEIEAGIEGLVHMSEMDWTNKNIHPSKILQVGDEVEVMVLEIDEKRRRISLGLKQCIPNPWAEFSNVHKKGDHVSGKIKSITDFGIFIGLDGAIDGLVHMSDISWTQPAEKAIRDYKKGDEVSAVVLAIDPERERISLGIKQLDADPIPQYLEHYPRGTSVTGKVVQVDDKFVYLKLTEDTGVQGCLKVSEIDTTPEVESEITAWVLGLDRKGEFINLTMKEAAAKKPSTEEKASKADRKEPEASATATLGDLIQEQINKDAE
jgi:small subunit ribosomal protein S1